jgi:hypothetical protein
VFDVNVSCDFCRHIGSFDRLGHAAGLHAGNANI